MSNYMYSDEKAYVHTPLRLHEKLRAFDGRLIRRRGTSSKLA